MYSHSKDLNDPSFFRKGGLLMPLGPDQVHIQVGKNGDGSWYIQLDGKPNRDKPGLMRSHMTPRQMFELCAGTLSAMGYTNLDIKPPDEDASYQQMMDEANRA
jgi:hypothetical protein